MQVAIKTKHWTLDEPHSLPDDGNKYEVVRGELFVTPGGAGPHGSPTVGSGGNGLVGGAASLVDRRGPVTLDAQSRPDSAPTRRTWLSPFMAHTANRSDSPRSTCNTPSTAGPLASAPGDVEDPLVAATAEPTACQ